MIDEYDCSIRWVVKHDVIRALVACYDTVSVFRTKKFKIASRQPSYLKLITLKACAVRQRVELISLNARTGSRDQTSGIRRDWWGERNQILVQLQNMGMTRGPQKPRRTAVQGCQYIGSPTHVMVLLYNPRLIVLNLCFRRLGFPSKQMDKHKKSPKPVDLYRSLRLSIPVFLPTTEP